MIYLDHNATSPVLPPVRTEIIRALDEQWANPSSAHALGLGARAVVEKARAAVTQLLGADNTEVVFTSSATEANNTALFSAIRSTDKTARIVTIATEHSAVLTYCQSCKGVNIEVLPVESDGRVDPKRLDAALFPGTTLLSMMWANNETGVIHAIPQALELCHARGILMHCDAVQAAGRIPLNLREVPIDYLSVSAHKLHGPKGIGALVVARGAPFSPLFFGGHQESDKRAGTENVPAIAGFGKAAELARVELDARARFTSALRDRLEAGILRRLPKAYINGRGAPRIPTPTTLGFPGSDSDVLVTRLDQRGICVSSGSACLADSVTPSHVVHAMTNSYERANEAIRFSLSHLNTAEEIDAVINEVATVVGTPA